jgi:hypothetical protein
VPYDEDLPSNPNEGEKETAAWQLLTWEVVELEVAGKYWRSPTRAKGNMGDSGVCNASYMKHTGKEKTCRGK